MKLYMIHAGFYDKNVSDGFHESHTNYFVAAESLSSAKKRAHQIPEFRKMKMHIDGIMEISQADGYDIRLERSDNPDNENIQTYGYDEIRDL